MDRLWAPWRIKYIKSCADISGRKKIKGCVFCEASKSKAQNYVIFKTKYSISILNIFPYNNGHLMVSPRRHIKELSQLKKVEILDLFKTLNDAKRLLDKVLRPQGYNVGLNISRSAGAGILGHLHIHLVPRWNGDTNFMPVLSDTKVVSQSLNELYRQLKDAKSKTD